MALDIHTRSPYIEDIYNGNAPTRKDETMASKSKKTSPKFSDRERFNWGFWDGINDRDARRGLPEWYSQTKTNRGHFDPVYVEGYMAGAWWTGERPETSTGAWEAR
jgi:hypothetical protein